MSAPFVSFTAVRYRPGKAWRGALHMATQRRPLAREPGLKFARLLGTGSGIGFSAVPDLRTWALLAAWERAEDWERFAAASPVMRQYRDRGDEIYSLFLSPLSAHGRWGGVEPFAPLPFPPPRLDGGAPVAVLTRASIRLARLNRFWRRVAPVDETLRGNPDLLLTFGVGEVPWVRQATLSVWRTADAMKAWAYGTAAHADVVRRTRAEGWYAEELFARFRLLGTRGTFLGSDPLAALFGGTDRSTSAVDGGGKFPDT